MKRAWLLAATLLSASQVYATDVGVSVSIGQPGFYGQIDLGTYAPQPQVIYPQPVIIQQVPVYQRPAPIYLHVPPGHAKRWANYCGRYNACGRPVYFVQDSWYNDVYAPKYREYREHDDHGDYHHDDRHDYKGPKGSKGPKGHKGNDQGGPGHGNGHGPH